VDRGTLALRVAAAIKALPDRQRSVLLMHYEDGLKFRAMAKVLQVNHQRASAIHMQAIRSLRRRLGS
jgi:RNA polymerase sigma factor for flagellar operon FliA